MEENKIKVKENKDIKKYLDKGATIIFVAVDSYLEGFLVLEDTVKESIKDTIGQIKNNNAETIMLTGDNPKTANSIGELLSLDKVYAECSPEKKLSIIDDLQKDNKKVCMLGDGINDAPALKEADVGIAMGKIGSDMAIDSADIVLISDDLDKLTFLNKLSKKTIKTIYINLTISMTINFVFVLLSVLGYLTPIQGALVHNIGSFGVILNSALILKWKPKSRKESDK